MLSRGNVKYSLILNPLISDINRYNTLIMNKIHKFDTKLKWQGNTGQGTLNYKAYKRDYTISAKNKPKIEGSSDPVFLGDGTKYNPEELLIASASSCHMLWYLHLCADSGVVVTDYSDNAEGNMLEKANGSGRFKEIILNPIVTVKEKGMVAKALELHDKAGQMCFIANSCNFPIRHKPLVKVIE
jgi:organic hydroperoxide reductase OsmC/OhrA